MDTVLFDRVWSGLTYRQQKLVKDYVKYPTTTNRAYAIGFISGISCTRIGQDTAAEIMKLLPANIETIEKAIKRKRFDAEALLKLLWERNKLGYDGEVYHELS